MCCSHPSHSISHLLNEIFIFACAQMNANTATYHFHIHYYFIKTFQKSQRESGLVEISLSLKYEYFGKHKQHEHYIGTVHICVFICFNLIFDGSIFHFYFFFCYMPVLQKNVIITWLQHKAINGVFFSAKKMSPSYKVH